MGKSAGTEIEAAKPNCVDNAATAIVNRIWNLVPFSTANADLFHGICQEEIAAAIREDRAEPVSEAEVEAAAITLASQDGYAFSTLQGAQRQYLNDARELLQAARQARATADASGAR